MASHEYSNEYWLVPCTATDLVAYFDDVTYIATIVEDYFDDITHTATDFTDYFDDVTHIATMKWRCYWRGHQTMAIWVGSKKLLLTWPLQNGHLGNIALSCYLHGHLKMAV